MSKTYNTQLICLRAIEYGEADRILHCYSPDFGRFSVMAKGARKTGSKFASACQPLNIANVQLLKGKSMETLLQAQPVESFPGLRKNLLKLSYGLLFAEILNQTASEYETDSAQIFETLENGLHQLEAASSADSLPVALGFQIELLHMAGYHPVLDRCVMTDVPLDLSATYYCFSPELGGITTPEQRRLALEKRESGPRLSWVNVSGSTLQILSGSPASTAIMPEQALKAQKFLCYYYEQVFEKTFRSYGLLLDLLDTRPVTP